MLNILSSVPIIVHAKSLGIKCVNDEGTYEMRSLAGGETTKCMVVHLILQIMGRKAIAWCMADNMA